MNTEQFVTANRCEFVYHIAEPGSWETMRRLGLMSTTAILDACAVPTDKRERIEARHRPTGIIVKHPELGAIAIRDQDPLTDRPDSGLYLSELLEDGMEPEDWFRLLSGKVFFWVSYPDFLNMLCARLYRSRPHWVLKVDTRSLLSVHVSRASVSDQNTGSLYSRRMRGRSTFTPLSSLAVRSGIKELAIDHGVRDIEQHTASVDECICHWNNGERECRELRRIWP